MSDQNQPMDDEPKRRKLDELFADSPYLSPTMKARQLHERLTGAQNGNGAAQGLPNEACVSGFGDLTYGGKKTAIETTGMERIEPPVTLERLGYIGIADAAAFLRAAPPSLQLVSNSDEPGSEGRVRLVRFRDQILNEWIKRVPQREIDPSGKRAEPKQDAE